MHLFVVKKKVAITILLIKILTAQVITKRFNLRLKLNYMVWAIFNDF